MNHWFLRYSRTLCHHRQICARLLLVEKCSPWNVSRSTRVCTSGEVGIFEPPFFFFVKAGEGHPIFSFIFKFVIKGFLGNALCDQSGGGVEFIPENSF